MLFELTHELIRANRVDSAEVVLRRLSEIDPQYPWLVPMSALLRVRQGRYAEAHHEIQRADTTMSWNQALMARCEALLGRRGDALRRLASLEAARKVRYVDGALIARVYVALGDRDAAFRWLDRGFDDRSWTMMILSDFALDPIRADPRFRALEERVAAAAGKP